MSPDNARKNDLMCLAAGAIAALGADSTTATTIEELYRQTMLRVQTELLIVIDLLEKDVDAIGLYL